MITSKMPSGSVTTRPINTESTKPDEASRIGRPRIWSKSSSIPARNSRNATECREHVDDLVDLHEAEDGRTHDDPGDDLDDR